MAAGSSHPWPDRPVSSKPSEGASRCTRILVDWSSRLSGRLGAQDDAKVARAIRAVLQQRAKFFTPKRYGLLAGFVNGFPLVWLKNSDRLVSAFALWFYGGNLTVAMRIMKRLKQHPFSVAAHFDRMVAVSFAFPAAALRPLVPEGLEIDNYGDFGFVTAALVWTRDLRPAGFPKFLGQDFFLAGYRVFTRLRDESGRNLRGLKILRSETDRRRMVTLGNWMTGYNYRQVAVQIDQSHSETRVVTSLAGGEKTLDLTFDTELVNAPLPDGSPFPDWRTARRFAGPMPFTFSPEPDGRFVVVEGRRADWTPRPVVVKDWSVGLFDEAPLRGVTPILANAFMVENIDYHWSRGRIIRSGGIN